MRRRLNHRHLTAPRALALVALGAFVLAGCGDDDSAVSETPASADAPDTTAAPTTEATPATTDAPDENGPTATEAPTTEAPMTEAPPTSTAAPATTDAPETTDAPATTETADPLPPQFEFAAPGRYTTDVLGVTVSYDTPRDLLITLHAPGRIGMVDGFDPATGEYPPETGIALGFRRWAGWSTAEEATADVPSASIDPYDVDSWIATNDVIVLSDETTTVADHPARVFEVTVDPDTDVRADATGGGACFEGWEPCFYIGSATPETDTLSDWVSAKRVTRFYLLTIDGSEPVLISVGAPDGHPWFDEAESTVIASLELGPDAPPLD